MSSPRAKRQRLSKPSVSNDDSDDDTMPQTRSATRKLAMIREKKANDLQKPSSSNEESSNTGDSDSDKLLATCRLRNGLNDDCLVEIFKYLSVYDLIQLCELDVYFQNLIETWVIGRKLINFTKMTPCWTTNKIFQVFGKAMRKIKIAEENTLGLFERFLNFVTQYCAIGGLMEVELRFSAPTCPPEIMEHAMPYFSNIRRLALNDNYTRVSYKQFLTSFTSVATNLTHLTLEGIDVHGEWLFAGGMENLKELRLHASKRRTMSVEMTDLAHFLTTKRKLELFSFIGGGDITPLIDTLIEHCTKLKTFVNFHLNNPFNRASGGMSNELTRRHNYVRHFNEVTTIGLTSYTQCGSDLYEPLKKLAARNYVQALKIYINHDTGIILQEQHRMHYSNSDFGHFNRLKSIELQIKSESSDQCDLHAEFICEFIANLSNIEKLIVMSEPFLLNINKIIDLAPNLNVLGIANVKMKYLPVEMRKIIKSLRNRRAKLIANGQDDPPKTALIMNEQQWREVQIYKDINILIKSIIEYNTSAHTFNLSGA